MRPTVLALPPQPTPLTAGCTAGTMLLAIARSNVFTRLVTHPP